MEDADISGPPFWVLGFNGHIYYNKHERKLKLKTKLITFIQRETVLCIAGICAIISSFLVPPSKAYIDYIDFRVLALLFCLMIVVAGFQTIGLFENIIKKMIKHIHNTRKLAFALVLICFFTSMFITNDVALITFVPFAIMTLQKIKKEKLMIFVIVMQTIAANLGSMFTPLGNPQNLYLYSISQMDILGFLRLMFPVTCLSFVLIAVTLLFMKNEKIGALEEIGTLEEIGIIGKIGALEEIGTIDVSRSVKLDRVQMTAFMVLFAICLCTVLHMIDYRIAIVIVVITVLIFNRKLLAKADYLLLLTFVAFFIFVGNMKHMTYIANVLASVVSGNEIIVSTIVSQVISNVPAAILLSGFTKNYAMLILGTNIGGLGTLIASMASLISYKIYGKTEGARKGKYLAVFSVINLIYLFIILTACIIIV